VRSTDRGKRFGSLGSRFPENLVAGPTGLEPATSCVTGGVLADAWNNLGWELAALGFRRRPAEAYEMTLGIDPAYERARNNLALLIQRPRA